MTEQDIKNTNPWKEVAQKYKGADFLYDDTKEFICEADRKLIELFNSQMDAKSEKYMGENYKKPKDFIDPKDYVYNLHVPAFPWYGNPLNANVIVLSLNPGYVEKETVMAKVLQNLPSHITNGYIEHLRRMLTFEVDSFLPKQEGQNGITSRDLANLHQSYYWDERLKKAFVTEENNLTLEDINSKFAIIQYIGYSSKKYKSFRKNAYLPSQMYTRDLIQYILEHNKNAIFIISRQKQNWRTFIKPLYEANKDRFVESKDYLGQRFTENILNKETQDKIKPYDKVINAFKSPVEIVI